MENKTTIPFRLQRIAMAQGEWCPFPNLQIGGEQLLSRMSLSEDRYSVAPGASTVLQCLFVLPSYTV